MDDLNDEVLRNLQTYYENYKEHQAILATIRSQKKQYEQAIKRVTKTMDDSSNVIMKYMETYNHPGIKYHECYFLPKERRKRITNKEKKFDEVLEKHGISVGTNLHTALKNSLYEQSSNKKLVVKKISKT
jgi:hypothetical protein